MFKVRPREVILLSAPLVFIGAAGLYLSRYSAPQVFGSWRIEIDEAKVVPVTPRDVYDGYDTKVLLKMHLAGRPEASLGIGRLRAFGGGADEIQLVAVKAGRGRPLYGTLPNGGGKDDRKIFNPTFRGMTAASRDGTYTGVILMKLAALPADVGELKVRGKLMRQNNYDFFGQRRVVKIVSDEFEVTVKGEADRAAAPKVSRFQPFRVAARQSRSVPPALLTEFPSLDTNLTLAIQLKENALPQGEQVHVKWERPYIVDQNRKRVPLFDNREGDYTVLTRDVQHFGEEVVKRKAPEIKKIYLFSLAEQPKGRLKFRTLVSVNDCWPMPVEVVVREK
jgi:hypothetical protein